MILYLLKSVACLLVLLLVHRVIFQREAIYRFNRIYLLAAVLGSFFIPLMEIEVVQEVVPSPQGVSQEMIPSQDFQVKVFAEPVSSETVAEVSYEEKPNNWNLIFWAVYGVITLVLLIRFIRNINLLIDKIHRNVRLQYRGETLVLLDEQSLPFSFLSYIFVSKDYFGSGQLTDTIFAHEQAHVRGKHSWDNLLIEGLLVILWFHPGLYLARQAIKLNHEFIADEAALEITPLDQYKSFLLAMMLPDHNPGLASSLNFSLTKKRFEMMKRKTANSTKWMKMLGVAPILAGLVYFFSEKVPAQTEGEKNSKEVIDKDELSQEKRETHILLRADGQLEVDGQLIKLEQLQELIDSEINQNTLARISADPGVEMGQLADVQEILRENNIRQVRYQQVDDQVRTNGTESAKERHFKEAVFLIESAEMDYSQKSYYELSEKEKTDLWFSDNIINRKSPETQMFESWKNKSEFALWLDGKVISNDQLESLKPSDIALFNVSRVTANARSERFPQPFQVNLFSPKYYEESFGPNSKRFQPLTNQDTITLTQRNGTYMKDISRYPDPITAFLQKYVRYEKLRTSGTIYSHKSPEEKDLLDQLYQELNSEYSSSSDKRKKSLKQPIPPDSNTRRNGDLGKNSSEKTAVGTVGNSGYEVAYTLVYSPAPQSKTLKEYLGLYGQYQTKVYENRLFSQPSNQEIEDLHGLFRSLEAKYNQLLFEERRSVKRAAFPFARIEKDGKVVFKKFEDLTEEERKSLAC